MPEIKLQNAYRVDIIESERGWDKRSTRLEQGSNPNSDF